MAYTPRPGDIYLAIREEGKFVNAYFSRYEQPQDNLLIGSIATVIMHDHPELFEHWKEFMTLITGTVLEDIGVFVKEFVEQPAPVTPQGHA